MTRDIVENALRRVHSSALHNTRIEVFPPSESYSQGDGWAVTYPDTPTAVVDARVDEPSPDSDRERSGTVAEVDVVIVVRDDTGQTWTGYGEETEAALRVRDVADQTMYEIETRVDQHNGTLELEAVEV